VTRVVSLDGGEVLVEQSLAGNSLRVGRVHLAELGDVLLERVVRVIL
jgi:hypothetical protein